MMRAARTAALICLSLPGFAAAGATAVGKLCPDRQCNDPAFPVLDVENGECICKKHPCWNVNGMRFHCDKPAYPFIHYIWKKDKPECMCSSIPHYDSEYLTKVKCPNHGCDTEKHPVLDLDGKGECHCSSHPCDNIDGKLYECKTKEFPIRRYLTDIDGKGFCDCVARLEEPKYHSEL
mmetsp:Transcript_49736/g.118565  ORF Transcript_49736/g.118565 Transcript_49736/m.118565 type:complete len:178 (+) Transcript_49736:76-609(+)